jgi:hypothetical protein
LALFTGVWTLESKGEVPNVDISFHTAKPSYAHYALVELEKNSTDIA